MQRSLYLGVPVYGNMMHFGFHQSVCGLLKLCAERRIRFGMKYIGCDSLVPRARNTLVAKFRDSDCTDLIFIDADISFDPKDAISLLESDLPIVGAVYPRKQLDWNRIRAAARAGVPANELSAYGFIPVMNWTAAGEYPLDRPFPVRHLGTGFLRIRRHVIEAMIEKLGDSICFDYSSEQTDLKEKVGHELFPIGPDVRYPLHSGGRQYLSEDWSMCELAKMCGFDCYADPRIKLTHSGNYDYTGDLSIMDAAIEEELNAVDHIK